jgi:hypothetical protein
MRETTWAINDASANAEDDLNIYDQNEDDAKDGQSSSHDER